MTDDRSGWFNYSPLDPSSLERLTPEQRGLVEQCDEPPSTADEAIGEVHVFFRSLKPGQVEIQFQGPPASAPIDILQAAIRELQSAIAIYTD